MYIVNYKKYGSEYYSGTSISKKIENEIVNYNIFDDEEACRYIKLMPDKEFKGEMESEDKIREYIRYYYVEVLSKLDPENVYKELEWHKLVTFSDGDFNHGYIVSAWLELYLDIQVKCVNDDEIYVRNLKDVKPRWTVDILEEEIKKCIINTNGFNSVRAIYLFEQSEKLEDKADEIESRILSDTSLSKELVYKLSDRVCDYRQAACYKRCDADMAEDAWRERRREAKSKKKKKLVI